jgi:hypothetical protein
MKARLATLVEREGERHSYMTGKLGEAILVMERDGLTRDGAQRWRLMLATPERPAKATPEDQNRRGAAWRIERRKAEGVESLGGTD